MATGTAKWFNAQKGYGFVVPALPEPGGILQYRVKARINGQKRGVREGQPDRLAL